MESSTVLAFRIFVMLSCLIVVPLAAIFGSAFPDVVKTVLVDRIVSWSTGKPYEPSKSSTGFSQVTPDVAGGVAPASPWEAPRWGAQAPGAAELQPQSVARSAVVPAGGSRSIPPGGNQSASFSAADTGRGDNAGDPWQRATAAGRATIARADAAVDPRQASTPIQSAGEQRGAVGPGIAPRATSDEFTAIERKLRQYGATYYLLETYEGDLYRFHCKMAVRNNPNHTQPFEAADRDALRAMSRVLEQVETWRAGRLQ